MFENTRNKTILSAGAVAMGLALGAGAPRAQDTQDIIVDPDTTAVVVEIAPGADANAVGVADYCHAKIPVPEEKPPLSNDEPQITPDTRNWVDYYGPCTAADMRDAVMQQRPTNPDD